MPGLAQASSEQTVQVTLSSVGSNDRMLGVGQRHQTLVRPDAFHVTVLFQPTLAFLDKVVDILPAGVEAVSASSDILDEFVLRVYLPQLEEKVSMLFQQAVTGVCAHRIGKPLYLASLVSGSDAFQPDPLSMRLSPHPLIKVCYSSIGEYLSR
jgi:exocyst complex component 4